MADNKRCDIGGASMQDAKQGKRQSCSCRRKQCEEAEYPLEVSGLFTFYAKTHGLAIFTSDFKFTWARPIFLLLIRNQAHKMWGCRFQYGTSYGASLCNIIKGDRDNTVKKRHLYMQLFYTFSSRSVLLNPYLKRGGETNTPSRPGG